MSSTGRTEATNDRRAFLLLRCPSHFLFGVVWTRFRVPPNRVAGKPHSGRAGPRRGRDGLIGIERSRSAAVELYWIPVGAGGHSVRLNGRVFEAVAAARERRRRGDLYRAALVVELDGDRFTTEVAPSPDANEATRGVVATAPVGSRRLGRLRRFRYEVRRWRGGTIADLRFAVGGAQLLSTDPAEAERLLAAIDAVPLAVWGRDELNAGEMWNSNSVAAWAIASSGLPAARIEMPPSGRAPGWPSGLVVASRNGGSAVSARTSRSLLRA